LVDFLVSTFMATSPALFAVLRRRLRSLELAYFSSSVFAARLNVTTSLISLPTLALR